jgi:hypothetical protein
MIELIVDSIPPYSKLRLTVSCRERTVITFYGQDFEIVGSVWNYGDPWNLENRTVSGTGNSK